MGRTVFEDLPQSAESYPTVGQVPTLTDGTSRLAKMSLISFQGEFLYLSEDRCLSKLTCPNDWSIDREMEIWEVVSILKSQMRAPLAPSLEVGGRPTTLDQPRPAETPSSTLSKQPTPRSAVALQALTSLVWAEEGNCGSKAGLVIASPKSPCGRSDCQQYIQRSATRCFQPGLRQASLHSIRSCCPIAG